MNLTHQDEFLSTHIDIFEEKKIWIFFLGGWGLKIQILYLNLMM